MYQRENQGVVCKMIKITIDINDSLTGKLSDFKGFDVERIFVKYLQASGIKNFDTMRRFFDEGHEFINIEH